MRISSTAFAELLGNARGVYIIAIHKPWDYSPFMVNGSLSATPTIEWGRVEYRSLKSSHYFSFYECGNNFHANDTDAIIFPKTDGGDNEYHLFSTEYGLLITMVTRRTVFAKGYDYTTILLNDNDRTPM